MSKSMSLCAVAMALFTAPAIPCAAQVTAQAEAAESRASIRPAQSSAAEQAAVEAANSEIHRRLQARTMPAGVSADAMAVVKAPSGDYALIVRYRNGWTEWSQSYRMASGDDGLTANAAQVAVTVDLTPLEPKIISQSEADRLVKLCNARLAAVVKPLQAPFYHQLTNVRWDARAGAPMLRAYAVLSEQDNQCVRADLNLVTGVSMCRAVACSAR